MTVSYNTIIGTLRALELAGVVSPAHCTNEGYYHWSVKKAEALPECFKADYAKYGEVRYYCRPRNEDE